MGLKGLTEMDNLMEVISIFDLTSIFFSISILGRPQRAGGKQPGEGAGDVYLQPAQAGQGAGKDEHFQKMAKLKVLKSAPKVLAPPYPDYYKIQQQIWKCIWMRHGNRIVTGHARCHIHMLTFDHVFNTQGTIFRVFVYWPALKMTKCQIT